MARGDPILCQDPGDVLQFANQTRSEALVLLFDEGCSIKDLHVVEAGQESRGISAQPGDTFAVTNADGRLLYEHAMPVKHAHSDTEQRAMRLLNLHSELSGAMKLMTLLDKLSADLLNELACFEMQLTRSNEEVLRSIRHEKDLDLISAVQSAPKVAESCLQKRVYHAPRALLTLGPVQSEDELFLDGDDLEDDSAVMLAAEAWELTLKLNREATALTDHAACDLAYLMHSKTRAASDPGVDILLAKATERGLAEALRYHSLSDAQKSLRLPPFVELH